MGSPAVNIVSNVLFTPTAHTCVCVQNGLHVRQTAILARVGFIGTGGGGGPNNRSHFQWRSRSHSLAWRSSSA